MDYININSLHKEAEPRLVFEANLDVVKGKVNKTYSISIPNTSHNNKELNSLFSKYVNRKVSFPAKYTIEGVVFTGILLITEISEFLASALFITGNGLVWDSMQQDKLQSVDLSHRDIILNKTNVINSEEGYPFVVFDLVDRGAFKGGLDSIDITDRYPAINISQLLTELFNAYGFSVTIEDNLGYFNELYLLFTGSESVKNSEQWVQNSVFEALAEDHYEYSVSGPNNQTNFTLTTQLKFPIEKEDIGNNYDNATWEYTIPETGTYTFIYDYYLSIGRSNGVLSGLSYSIQLRKNNIPIGVHYVDVSDLTTVEGEIFILRKGTYNSRPIEYSKDDVISLHLNFSGNVSVPTSGNWTISTTQYKDLSGNLNKFYVIPSRWAGAGSIIEISKTLPSMTVSDFIKKTLSYLNVDVFYDENNNLVNLVVGDRETSPTPLNVWRYSETPQPKTSSVLRFKTDKARPQSDKIIKVLDASDIVENKFDFSRTLIAPCVRLFNNTSLNIPVLWHSGDPLDPLQSKTPPAQKTSGNMRILRKTSSKQGQYTLTYGGSLSGNSETITSILQLVDLDIRDLHLKSSLTEKKTIECYAKLDIFKLYSNWYFKNRVILTSEDTLSRLLVGKIVKAEQVENNIYKITLQPVATEELDNSVINWFSPIDNSVQQSSHNTSESSGVVGLFESAIPFGEEGQFFSWDKTWRNISYSDILNTPVLVSSFGELSDTVPYTQSDALKYIRVNSNASGLEYASIDLSNYVTLGTAQVITGSKTFYANSGTLLTFRRDAYSSWYRFAIGGVSGSSLIGSLLFPALQQSVGWNLPPDSGTIALREWVTPQLNNFVTLNTFQIITGGKIFRNSSGVTISRGEYTSQYLLRPPDSTANNNFNGWLQFPVLTTGVIWNIPAKGGTFAMLDDVLFDTTTFAGNVYIKPKSTTHRMSLGALPPTFNSENLIIRSLGEPGGGLTMSVYEKDYTSYLFRLNNNGMVSASHIQLGGSGSTSNRQASSPELTFVYPGNNQYGVRFSLLSEPSALLHFYLPTTLGTAGQVLSTNGGGQLSWTTVTAGGNYTVFTNSADGLVPAPQIADGSVKVLSHNGTIHSWVTLSEGVTTRLRLNSSEWRVGDLTLQTLSSDGVSISEPSNGTFRITHTDTSTVNNITPSGLILLSGMEFDTYGHVTSVSTKNLLPASQNGYFLKDDGTWVAINIPEPIVYIETRLRVNALSYMKGDITFINGSGITLSSNGTSSITIEHASSQFGSGSSNSGLSYIQNIGLDSFGHINSISSASIPTFSGSTAGLVPAVIGQAGRFLKDDGTWAIPGNNIIPITLHNSSLGYITLTEQELRVWAVNLDTHTTGSLPLVKLQDYPNVTGKYLSGQGWANVSEIGGTTETSWGNITGILSNQSDLQNALNSKQDTIPTSTDNYFYAGNKQWREFSYTFLSNKPSIPDINDLVTKAGADTITGIKTFVGTHHLRIKPTTGTLGYLYLTSSSENSFVGGIAMGTLGAHRTWTLPNKDGTFAMLSDIPANPDLSGYVTLAGANQTITGQKTFSVSTFFSSARMTYGMYNTSIQAGALMGNTIFQLPANNGSSGQFLRTDGNGITSWSTVTGSKWIDGSDAGRPFIQRQGNVLIGTLTHSPSIMPNLMIYGGSDSVNDTSIEVLSSTNQLKFRLNNRGDLIIGRSLYLGLGGVTNPDHRSYLVFRPNNSAYNYRIGVADGGTETVTLLFPNSYGSAGQALVTDANGNLSWATVGGGGSIGIFNTTTDGLVPKANHGFTLGTRFLRDDAQWIEVGSGITTYLQVPGGTPRSGNLNLVSGQKIVIENAPTDSSFRISHLEISIPGSVSNSGNTVIQSLGLDGYGHITSVSVKTFNNFDLNNAGLVPSPNNSSGLFLSSTGWATLPQGTSHNALSLSSPNRYLSLNAAGQILTANLVDIAHLNTTGTASASTFLRGDGQWVQISSGGGGGDGTVTSVSAGMGMNFATFTTSGTIILGTPLPVTTTSTNGLYPGSHSHALTLPSNTLVYGASAGNLGSLAFSGNAGKGIRVNSSATDLEFFTISSGSDVNFVNSIILNSSNVSLVNDSNSPGASRYYGTNAFGTKGWYVLPDGDGSGSGGSESDPHFFEWLNSTELPDRYYGTSSNGTKGWYPIDTNFTDWLNSAPLDLSFNGNLVLKLLDINNIEKQHLSVNLDGRYYTISQIGQILAGTLALTGYNKTNWDSAYSWTSTTGPNVVTNVRQITINGVTQNLSADRSWNVGTVTSVNQGNGVSISGSSISPIISVQPLTTISGDIGEIISNSNGIGVRLGNTGTSAAPGNHTHNELHYRSHSITSTSDHSAGNWKTFYSNGSGNIVEISLSNNNHIFVSKGINTAPQFIPIHELPTFTTNNAGLVPAPINQIEGEENETRYLDASGNWTIPTGTGTGMSNPMTNAGDMIYRSASNSAVRLGIGSNGQILRVVSGLPTWVNLTDATFNLHISGDIVATSEGGQVATLQPAAIFGKGAVDNFNANDEFLLNSTVLGGLRKVSYSDLKRRVLGITEHGQIIVGDSSNIASILAPNTSSIVQVLSQSSRNTSWRNFSFVSLTDTVNSMGSPNQIVRVGSDSILGFYTPGILSPGNGISGSNYNTQTGVTWSLSYESGGVYGVSTNPARADHSHSLNQGRLFGRGSSSGTGSMQEISVNINASESSMRFDGTVISSRLFNETSPALGAALNVNGHSIMTSGSIIPKMNGTAATVTLGNINNMWLHIFTAGSIFIGGGETYFAGNQHGDGKYKDLEAAVLNATTRIKIGLWAFELGSGGNTLRIVHNNNIRFEFQSDGNMKFYPS